MAIDLKVLKAKNEQLAKGSGSDKFLKQKDMTEDGIDFRILPPPESLAGNYFLEVILYWINNKPYISPATFGKPCPIAAEVEKAKAEKDPELSILLEDTKLFKKDTQFWVAGLQMQKEYGEDNELISSSVVGEKAKVLQCGRMLIQGLNKIVLSRQAQNGTENGIADRIKGRDIILSKSGKGMETKYAAEACLEITKVDKKYVENVPDVYQMATEDLKSDKYLKSVMRNYLYGEAIIEDKPKTDTKGTKKAPVKSEPEDDEDEDYDEDMEDDVDDEEEEEEETPPTKPKTVVKEAKKPETKKAETKKAEPKKEESKSKRVARNVLEDLEDVD